MLDDILSAAYKAKNIAEGWANYTFPNEEAEKVAKERTKICANCPFAEHSSFVDFIEFKAVEMKGFVCTKCSCPVTKAVRAMNYSCPLKKWDAVN